MTTMHGRRWTVGGVLFGAALVGTLGGARSLDRWTADEVETLTSLWLGRLEPPPPDPTNRFADDPGAADLGHRLFFEPRLSADGSVSCATCHDPALGFQDGRPLATGIGTTMRRTMPVAGTAWSPFLFWDGRKDSQWSQALGPLESPVEHGGTRTWYAHVVQRHYRAEFEEVFGPMPDLSRLPADAGPTGNSLARAAWAAMDAADREAVTDVFANVGKAIAAYERRLRPGPARFDAYVAALVRDGRAPADLLRADEVEGLRLFIGKGNCTRCHNGPLLTDDHFHNTGVPARGGLPHDEGRAAGAPAVLDDEFNCLSRYSDASPGDCRELTYMTADGDELVRAFKTPSLRNVADRAPFMHAGQLATLADVIRHYDRAPRAPAGHSELVPLNLGKRELRQLEAFLHTLSGGVTADQGRWLRAPGR